MSRLYRYLPGFILLNVIAMISVLFIIQSSTLNKDAIFDNSYSIIHVIDKLLKTSASKEEIQNIVEDLGKLHDNISFITVLNSNMEAIYHSDKYRVNKIFRNRIIESAFNFKTVQISEYKRDEDVSSSLYHNEKVLIINYPVIVNPDYVRYVISIGININYISKIITLYQILFFLFVLGIVSFFLYNYDRNKREKDLDIKNKKLKDTIQHICEAFSKIVEMKDQYTRDHQERVAKISYMIAELLDYNDEQLENIYISGLLHDLGKINIPEEILNKSGKLTKEEYEVIKTHPVIGYNIVKGIKNLDNNIYFGIKEHHEKIDGSGYPEGKIVNINTFAQIIAVADTFEAGVSSRPYKEMKTPEVVINEMYMDSGLNVSYVKILDILFTTDKLSEVFEGDPRFVPGLQRN